jgi:hypothetical protein
MALYERLLEESEGKERLRRGWPLGTFCGSDFPVLDRRLLADAPEDRPPGVGSSASSCGRARWPA